jgi:xanthine/CO dehydrogenase XdhC/CoxF family maturation factor
MSELKQILALWRAAKARKEEVCLATVVRTEGPSYRKAGARMLLTRSGQRAGTISGGCLEGEVSKKAWWLTENGPTVQRYSSFFDDDSPLPYGSGCGGTVYILLERGPAAHAVLDALEASVTERRAFVSVIDTNCGRTLLVRQDSGTALFVAQPEAEHLAEQAFRERRSFYASDAPEVFVEYAAPPAALTIFGAGDDAKPLTEFAASIGWHVVIADGRSHLARKERFPAADAVHVLDYESSAPLSGLDLDPENAFVLMTHSYEQDRALLRELLPLSPKYLGVLGPRARTERIVTEIADAVGLSPEECMERLHSPVGFDLGAHSPEGIALAIAAEIFAFLHGREQTDLKHTHLLHASK